MKKSLFSSSSMTSSSTTMERLFPRTTRRQSSTATSRIKKGMSHPRSERVPQEAEERVPNGVPMKPIEPPAAVHPRNNVHKSQGDDLLMKLEAKLPCNSGIALSAVEGDQMNEHIINGLVQLAMSSPDYIVWKLCHQIEKLFTHRCMPDHTFAPDVLDSHLYLLKALTRVLNARWPAAGPSSPTSPAPAPHLPPSPAFPRPHPSDTSLRSAATARSWAEPRPLADDTARYALHTASLFLRGPPAAAARALRSLRAAAPADGSMYAWDAADWEPALAAPQRRRPTDPSDIAWEQTALPVHGASDRGAFAHGRSGGAAGGGSLYTMYAHEYARDVALHGSYFASVAVLVAKYAGRVVYNLSASNWPVVFHRIQRRIRCMADDPGYAAHPAPSAPSSPPPKGKAKRAAPAAPSPSPTDDCLDLRLLIVCLIDRGRLAAILHEFATALGAMAAPAQDLAAIAIRAAITTWIADFPKELAALWSTAGTPHEATRRRRALEGHPERLFDTLLEISALHPKRAAWLFPALASLLSIAPDRLEAAADAAEGAVPLTKKNSFLAQLSHPTTVKHHPSAPHAFLDLARAAFALAPSAANAALRVYGGVAARELQRFILHPPNGGAPFYARAEPIDVNFYAYCVAALFRFRPEEVLRDVMLVCLEPQRSAAVKLVVVKALVLMVVEAGKYPWQPSLEFTYPSVTPRMRGVCMALLGGHDEIVAGVPRPPAAVPTCRSLTLPAAASADIDERVRLVLQIETLFTLEPPFWLYGTTDADHSFIQDDAKSMLREGGDKRPKATTVMGFCAMLHRAVHAPPETPWYAQAMRYCFFTVQSGFFSMSLWLLNADGDDYEFHRMAAACLHTTLQHLAEGSPYDQDPAWRFTPLTTGALPVVEFALWTALSSSQLDISASAQRSLRLLSAFTRHPALPPLSPAAAARAAVLEGLGDPRAVIVGRVAALRRICKHVALLGAPTPVLVLVFRQFLHRWEALMPRVCAVPPAKDELLEWENKMCIMAVAAGALFGEEEDLPLGAALEPILPVHLRGRVVPGEMVMRFVRAMVWMLDGEVLQVRQKVKDALAHSLSLRLVPTVIGMFTMETERRFRPDAGEDEEKTLLFVEQMMAVVNVLFARIDGTEVVFENASGQQTIVLGKYISSLPITTRSLRLRIIFCTTADLLLSKRHLITIRYENEFRNMLADTICAWIEAPPHQMSSEGQSGDYRKVAMESHIAAMRSFVRTLDTMHIVSTEPASADPPQPSRVFRRYLMALVQTLVPIRFNDFSDSSVSVDRSSHQSVDTHDNEALVNELVVSGVAHLLNNNLEAGIRHCLEYCYGEDFGLRVLLMKAFTRVLNFGTKFDPARITAPKEPDLGLCKLLVDCEMIARATLDACPTNEIDRLYPVLIHVFNTRKSIVNLLKILIDREFKTGVSDIVLRGNEMTSRILGAFARQHGYQYLRTMLEAIIKHMRDVPEGCSYEIDPAKMPPGEDLERNVAMLSDVAQKFIDFIATSVKDLPPIFNEISAYIGKVVTAVCPERKYNALGSFLILRFICPAIVSPITVDVDLDKEPRSPVLRRGLLLVAKVLQSIANNALFIKEPYLKAINPILTENTLRVNKFLSDSQYYPSTADEAEFEIGAGCDETDALILNGFFHANTEAIGKSLLAQKDPSPDRSKFATGKDAWDALCFQLVEMGTAYVTPTLSPSPASDHTAYNEFMSRNSHRDTDGLVDIFSQYPSPKGIAFVFTFSQVDIETLDFELLLYFVFNTIAATVETDSEFHLVFDFTGFTRRSEFPIAWLKLALELSPSDFRMRWRSAFILNTNAMAQIYLRKVLYIFSDLCLIPEIVCVSSVWELQRHLGESFMLPSPSATLEIEQITAYEGVHQQIENHSWSAVRLCVGEYHLRIISARTHQLSPAVHCYTVEVIHFHEVEDVYKAHEEHQLVVRRLNRAPSLTLFSTTSDRILKEIQDGKQRAAMAKPPLLPTSGISDLSATLLAIGLLHASHQIEYIRGAAYELLAANCAYMRYPPDAHVPWRGSFIPTNSLAFIVDFSRRMAAFAPQMTVDFMHEWSRGFDSATEYQKITCIHIISPWLRNLNAFLDPSSKLFDETGSKVKGCIQILLKMTIQDSNVHSVLQRAVWLSLAQSNPELVEIVVDELIHVAVDGGTGSRRCEIVADTLIAFSTVQTRARVLNELRKLVSDACQKPTSSLMETKEWKPISALSRLVLVAGHSPTLSTNNRLHAPEMAHLVAMLAATGTLTMRSTIYGIAVNLLQALHIARAHDEAAVIPIRLILDDMASPEYLKLFGLNRRYPSSEISILEPVSPHIPLDSLEKITTLLLRALDLGSTSSGLGNVWRSRWTSLVTTTAFQSWGHTQSRSFTILGHLVGSAIDDDMFYQMLMVIRKNIRTDQVGDMSSIWCILRCLRRGLPSLLEPGYLLSVFWLSIAFLHSGTPQCYVEAMSLLRGAVEVMDRRAMFSASNGAVNPVESVLMQARGALSHAALRLDMASGLSFQAHFGFALVMSTWHNARTAEDVKLVREVLLFIARVSIKAANPSAKPQRRLDSLSTALVIGLAPGISKDEYARLLAEDFQVALYDITEHEGLVETGIRLSVLDVNDATASILATSFLLALEESRIVSDEYKENIRLYWSKLVSLHPEICSLGMYYFLNTSRMSYNMESSFTLSSSTANLEDGTTYSELLMAHTTPTGSPMTSSTTLGMDNGLTGPTFDQRLADINMPGAVEPYLASDPRRAEVLLCIPDLIDLIVQGADQLPPDDGISL